MFSTIGASVDFMHIHRFSFDNIRSNIIRDLFTLRLEVLNPIRQFLKDNLQVYNSLQSLLLLLFALSKPNLRNLPEPIEKNYFIFIITLIDS